MDGNLTRLRIFFVPLSSAPAGTSPVSRSIHNPDDAETLQRLGKTGSAEIIVVLISLHSRDRNLLGWAAHLLV